MKCQIRKSVMMGDVTTTTELLQIFDQPSVNEFRQLLWNVLNIGSERAFLCFVLNNTFELIGNDGLQSLRNKAIEIAKKKQKALDRLQRKSSSCDISCETSAAGRDCGPRSGLVRFDLRSRDTSRTRRSSGAVHMNDNLKAMGENCDERLHLNEKEEDVKCIKKKKKLLSPSEGDNRMCLSENVNDKNNKNNSNNSNNNLSRNKYFNEKKKSEMLNGLNRIKNESESDLIDFDIDDDELRALNNVTKSPKCDKEGKKRKLKNVENSFVECDDMPPLKRQKLIQPRVLAASNGECGQDVKCCAKADDKTQECCQNRSRACLGADCMLEDDSSGGSGSETDVEEIEKHHDGNRNIIIIKKYYKTTTKNYYCNNSNCQINPITTNANHSRLRDVATTQSSSSVDNSKHQSHSDHSQNHTHNNNNHSDHSLHITDTSHHHNDSSQHHNDNRNQNNDNGDHHNVRMQRSTRH